MITHFIGKIEDVYASTYTKKDTGEVVEQVEITATYRQRSRNGKLYMFTEHFRFTSEQLGTQISELKNSVGKFIAVPYEKQQFGKNVYVSPCLDLDVTVFDHDPFVKSQPEKIKKAS